jgi:hypothetical protein
VTVVRDFEDDGRPLTGEAKRQYQSIMQHAEIHSMRDTADEIARIADKVSRPLQDVESVNNDPRELALGYWVLAARAREDVRTLLKIGWGIRAEV